MTDGSFQHDAEQPKLEIEYPCPWRYRIIASDEAALRADIAQALGDQSFELTTGNESRNGKYVSVELAIVVEDEQHRTSILASLQVMEGVKYVL